MAEETLAFKSHIGEYKMQLMNVAVNTLAYMWHWKILVKGTSQISGRMHEVNNSYGHTR